MKVTIIVITIPVSLKLLLTIGSSSKPDGFTSVYPSNINYNRNDDVD